MMVTKGTSYTCKTCKCELVASKTPDRCPTGDCGLSCCGELMLVK